MFRFVRRLLGNERAATAIEYGLIATLISLAIIGALLSFAGAGVGIWNDINNKVTAPGT
jgi:pilus assembly protein Flp/PilA